MILKSRDRMPGWEARVQTEIENMDPSQYQFGVRDCFHSFMAIERAMYGTSLWERRYSEYASHEDAKEKLRSRVKVRNAAEFLNRVYEPVTRADVRFGDMSVEIFGFGLPHIYICDGTHMVTYLPTDGFGVPRHHLTHFNHFWRI